jgi:hypothetical protein
MDLFLKYKDVSTYENSINKKCQFNRMKEIVIISINAEKSVHQNSTPFLIKTPNKLGREGNFSNIDRGIFKHRALQL